MSDEAVVRVEPRRQNWPQFWWFVGGLTLVVAVATAVGPHLPGFRGVLLFTVGFVAFGTLIAGLRLNASTWWTRVKIHAAPSGFPRGAAHLVRHDDAVVIESLRSGLQARLMLVSAVPAVWLVWNLLAWAAATGSDLADVVSGVFPVLALTVLAGLRAMATPFRATVPHRAITEARRDGRELRLEVRAADGGEPELFRLRGTPEDVLALLHDLARRGVSVQAGRATAAGIIGEQRR